MALLWMLCECGIALYIWGLIRQPWLGFVGWCVRSVFGFGLGLAFFDRRITHTANAETASRGVHRRRAGGSTVTATSRVTPTTRAVMVIYWSLAVGLACVTAYFVYRPESNSPWFTQTVLVLVTSDILLYEVQKRMGGR